MANFVKIMIGLLLVVIIVTGIVFAVYWFGFENKFKVFTITINDEQYTENVSGLIIPKETTVSVNRSEYIVEVSALPITEDFTFNVGSELWSWSDLSSYDLTMGFDIALYNDSFTIKYEDLSSVIRNVIGYNIDVSFGNVPWCDLFNMRIKSGDQVIDIKFTLEGIFRVELDKPAIIF